MKATKNLSPEKEILLRNKRSTVLAIATRTGIKKTTGFDEFNQWMKSKSILKKDLHRYDFEELDRLIIQFRALERNYEASAKKIGNKAWHHKTGIPQMGMN